MALTFLTGGIRSGKSQLATELVAAGGDDVAFIATADAGDDDMRRRIERHRARRPRAWLTIEERLDLAGALRRAAARSLVIVDCLTLWVSNMMHDGGSDADILEHSLRALDEARDGVVVTNEVGSGIVPDNTLARRFEDTLGAVNVQWSRRADAAFLVVAGRLVRLGRYGDA
jgi:adenosylcobinamide kinase/adenosylcobinamide-phosphate guanylyltransferase